MPRKVSCFALTGSIIAIWLVIQRKFPIQQHLWLLFLSHCLFPQDATLDPSQWTLNFQQAQVHVSWISNIRSIPHPVFSVLAYRFMYLVLSRLIIVSCISPFSFINNYYCGSMVFLLFSLPSMILGSNVHSSMLLWWACMMNSVGIKSRK